jgi:hypothetical protein
MNTPWIRDIIIPLNPVRLNRDQFIAKYFPQYVKPWRPDYRIHLRPDGRPSRMPIAGDFKSQQTKRDNRINAAFENYNQCFDAQISK